MFKVNVNEAANYNWMIASTLKSLGLNPQQETITACSYLMYRMIDDDKKDTLKEYLDSSNSIKNENICYAIKDLINNDLYLALKDSLHMYEKDGLATLVVYESNYDPLSYKTESSTPSTLVTLVKELLGPSDHQRIADIGCGYGNFITTIGLDSIDAAIHGYEINAINAAIAMMRCELIGLDGAITITDVLTLFNSDSSGTYDRVFSNYPFGLRIRKMDESNIINRFEKELGGRSKSTSSDWLFNYLLVDLLNNSGKAVGIMTNGSTWNSADISARKYFVEKGLIECIIALPARLFHYTSIPTTLIILSKGNKNVRLIDATKMCIEGRRYTEFSEDNIKQIVEATKNDGEFSKAISVEELRENEYTLSYNRYVEDKYTIKDGVRFEDVIESITRGAHLSATELDKLISNEPTEYQYLMLANIQDGIIDEKLPYLTSIEERDKKYCLNNNSLVISKNGYPYKVAVASIEEGQNILANGNLYVIDLDENKVDPYYLKAFFESEKGIAGLKSITVGATIPNIGVEKLRKLQIPLPPLEEQRKIALDYQAAIDEVKILRQRLAKAVDNLHHVFDMNMEV